MKLQQIKQEEAKFAVLQMRSDRVSVSRVQGLTLIGQQRLVRGASAGLFKSGSRAVSISWFSSQSVTPTPDWVRLLKFKTASVKTVN